MKPTLKNILANPYLCQNRELHPPTEAERAASRRELQRKPLTAPLNARVLAADQAARASRMFVAAMLGELGTFIGTAFPYSAHPIEFDQWDRAEAVEGADFVLAWADKAYGADAHLFGPDKPNARRELLAKMLRALADGFDPANDAERGRHDHANHEPGPPESVELGTRLTPAIEQWMEREAEAIAKIIEKESDTDTNQ